MNKNAVILGIAAALAAGSASAELKAFKVNGETVSVAEQKAIYDQAVAQGQPAGADLERQVKNVLINETVLLQEAKKAKIANLPEVKRAIEAARNRILIQGLAQDWVKKNPVSDADLKKAYDADKKAYGDTEYQVRHILVKTEDQAKRDGILRRHGQQGSGRASRLDRAARLRAGLRRRLLLAQARRSRPGSDPHAVRLPRREARSEASRGALPELRHPEGRHSECARLAPRAGSLPGSREEGEGSVISA